MSTGAPSATAQAPSFSSIGIKNTDIKTAAGVDLSDTQKVLVGSVLDLFEGRPSLKHFSLWSQDATFTDPLTVASGYARYTAQFYGLTALFRPIELQSHCVTSAGDPLEMEMSNRYVVKGIGKGTVVNSVVRISVGQHGKIDRVEDRWNGKLPDGAISDAFRKLNGITVPSLVKVPRTEEEDMEMKANREKE